MIKKSQEGDLYLASRDLLSYISTKSQTEGDRLHLQAGITICCKIISGNYWKNYRVATESFLEFNRIVWRHFSPRLNLDFSKTCLDGAFRFNGPSNSNSNHQLLFGRKRKTLAEGFLGTNMRTGSNVPLIAMPTVFVEVGCFSRNNMVFEVKKNQFKF